MAPRASKNFEQRQPITTTLRSICESYPANTNLKELLQNADDAGASEFEIVLDTKSYAGLGPFLHEGLADYSGPAVLARNNSVFTDRDFESLSSVGDSCKRHDPASTGKFGQGFNSVYHWSDGPQIYSRDTLLILDPHRSWSRDTEQPGGPAWDVAQNHDSLEMKNQLATFGAFQLDLGRVLPETIVRIPLRTTEQAKTSKIKQHAPRVDEIEQILRQFCEDIEQGQLLFLKNVCKVTVRMNHNVLLTAQKSFDDQSKRAAVPKEFSLLYSSADAQKADVALKFVTKINYENATGFRSESFLVQHYMSRSCGDPCLDKWAKEWKLFPWVAVAAPIGGQVDFAGRLFSTLKLPLDARLPVHVHGLFAIAPDRARLGFEPEAIAWNTFLFRDVIPTAWSQILEHQSQEDSCSVEQSPLWPAINRNAVMGDLWNCLDDYLIDKVIKRKSCVWRTTTNCFSSLEESFVKEQSSDNCSFAKALAQAGVSTILLVPDFFDKVQQRANICKINLQLMQPRAVRSFLLRKTSFSAPIDTVGSIMEFLLLDANHAELKIRRKIFGDIVAIAIWPTLNGTTTKAQSLLLPRDLDELELFAKARPSSTVDIRKLAQKTLQLLLRDIRLMKPMIRHRDPSLDLTEDWPALYAKPSHSETTAIFEARLVEQDSVLRDIWTWVLRHAGKIPTAFEAHWFVPVKKSKIRRFLPIAKVPPTLIVLQGGLMAEVLDDIESHVAESAPTILDGTVLGNEATRFISSLSRDKFCYAVSDDVQSLARWLFAARHSLTQLASDSRKKLLSHLSEITPENVSQKPYFAELRSHVRQLPIFTKTTCKLSIRSIDVGALKEDCGLIFELPLDLPKISDHPGVCLCDLSLEAERKLVMNLGLIQVSREQLLKQFLLPWMQSESDGTVKRKVADWIFSTPNSRMPTTSWIANVLSQPIVPLSSGPDQWGRVSDLIDPQSPFSNMFFPDENVFPDEDFYNRHRQTLIICGLSNGSDSSPLDRIKAFSKRKEKPQDLIRKVECLFTKSPGNNFNFQPNTLKMLRDLAWVPGWSPDNVQILHSPAKCRPNELAHLVDRVWGRIPFQVTGAWLWVLGWNKEPPSEILLKQLDLCIQSNDKAAIERLIPYLVKFDVSLLGSRAVVLGSQGSYLTSDRIFSPGEKLKVHSLMPYLDRVDTSFSKQYQEFLSRLPIRAEPSIEDLQGVQNRIREATESKLTEEPLAAIIATLEVAALLPCDSEEFAKLLIPDVTMELRDFHEIVHGDRISSGEVSKFNFTHPALSEALIEKLGIESCFERANRLQIDWEDQDEDEFVPRETLSTTINDTLNRYPVESTFNEFLANADDAKAQTISWILDEPHKPYPSNSLLTKELSQFQGAALFCHNDSVFSEADFKGFRDIGNGGKKDDELSTGMFGRGALSMYHFTDVPMMISAGCLLIIDPQQQFLPRNKFHKRKQGVKLSLAYVRSVAPDQLAPFDGVKGFKANVDEAYEGTIFRFPLRNTNAQPVLKEDGHIITPNIAKASLQDYLGIAQCSLLFLGNVNRIEFSIRGEKQPNWSVSAVKSDLSSNSVFEKMTIIVNTKDCEIKDEWHIGIEEIVSIPSDIPKPGKMRGKITECGVAACMSRGINGTRDTWLQMLHRKQRVFCRLPTDTASSLPICFHSSFAITGDRRSIPFMETDPLSKWNKWLMEKLSALYLNFLEHLAPQVGAEVFKIWPLCPKKDIDTSLSDVMARFFWDRIGTKHIHDKLFPCNSPVSNEVTKNDSSRAKTRKVRKRHVVTTLQYASFDFLSASKSVILEPLFELLGIELVRPGIRLEGGLRQVANSVDLSFIDAQWISRTFKAEENALLFDQCLSKLPAEDRSEALAVIFELLQPLFCDKSGDPSKGPKSLDGCWIVPRPGLDSPLGKLQVAEGEGEIEWHLEATLSERELFPFARKRFIQYPLRFRREGTETKDIADEGITKDLMLGILNGPFNIRKLSPEDLGGLLDLEESPAKSVFDSDIRDKWTPRFWKYLNRKFLTIEDNSPESVLEQTKLWNTAVYRTRGKDNKWHYLSPRDFENGPCIVQPDDDNESNMCSSISGLVCVDPVCLPEEMQGKRLKDCPSNFSRFLLALTRLGSVKKILEKCLSRNHRELLLELAASFIDELPSSKNKRSAASIHVLRQLPIWPRLLRPEHSHLSEFMAADDAVLCGHVDMFQSFLKGLENYIDPLVVATHTDRFKKLGLLLESAQQFWPFVCEQFPATLDDDKSRRDFVRLIRYMIANGLQTYTMPALDGKSRLCAPNEVYDHEEAIFQSAFHNEQHRFLHPDAQSLRSHYLAKGLRSRSRAHTLSAEDYLECLLAFDRFRQASPLDPALDRCGRTITDYLRFENPEFATWESSIWAQISKIPAFLTARNINERAYRQLRMQQVSQFRYYSSLEEVGQRGDIRLFWSQVRMLQNPLPTAVFGLRPHGAKPPVSAVYNHVRYLASICNEVGSDMSEFLEDIKASYNYLQAESETFVGLPGVKDAPIWLNISTTSSDLVLSEDLKPNFLSARHICLNAPDDMRQLKVARNFLVPYEKVLRALGCQAVVDLPEIEVAADAKSDSPLSLSWGKIRDMRTKSALCDVVFEAEGEHVPAHRVILASASKYCETQFLGPWGHRTDHTLIHLEDITAATLNALIDFAYTGEVNLPSIPVATPGSSSSTPVKNDKIADILDDALDLLLAADYWGMTALHKRIESYILAPGNNRQFVRVENVNAVQCVAERAQAPRLVKWCRDFREANLEWVMECERQAKEEEDAKKKVEEEEGEGEAQEGQGEGEK